jgi:hypothetical protein
MAKNLNFQLAFIQGWQISAVFKLFEKRDTDSDRDPNPIRIRIRIQSGSRVFDDQQVKKKNADENFFYQKLQITYV